MLDKIIKFSLHHKLLILAISAFIISYGGYTLLHLPVDIFPDLNQTTINIMTEAEGLAPEEVETLITAPLESSIQGLPGVQRVRSQSGVGLSIIHVEFQSDSDMYRNRQLVQEKISTIKQKLPSNINPILGPMASIMGEIQLIGLTSIDGSHDPMELRDLADWSIKPVLLTIPGIAQIINIGGGVRQYQILLSAEKIQKYQLIMEEIEHNLTDLSYNTTGGFIDIDQKEFLIRNLGAVKSKNDILNSVVGKHLGIPVLVKDIATVAELPMNKRGDASVNAQPAVIMSIQKEPGANTMALSQEIEKKIAEIKLNLPHGVLLSSHLFKQADFIERAISNIKISLRDGVILVFIILFLFLLNFRTTFITLTAIPLSFLITMIIFKLFGLSVNTMTLGGLAIAIGELVDDAIIDIENIFRRLKENKKLTQPKSMMWVVYQASSEVRNSIVMATIIVGFVFLPLFALDGIEGKFFAPLGIAYIISLVASMMVSLTVTPVLASFLLHNIPLLEQPEAGFITKLKNFEQKILHKIVDYPKTIILLTCSLLLFALLLFSRMNHEFLPKFNEGTATISLLAEPGISLAASNLIGTQAERAILKTPEVLSVSRRTGRAEMDEHAEGVHSSEIDVDFKTHGRPREIVLAEIRKNLSKIPDVFINIGQPISHRLDHLLSGVRAQIAIKVFGPDLVTLRQKGAEIFDTIKNIKGLVDVQVEQQVLIPQVKIALLRNEAAKFGIVLGDLANLLERALQGKVVGQVIKQQKFINILMRFDDASRSNLDLIKKTPIKIMPDGSKILLDQVADIYQSNGPNVINRENAQRRIVIQANTSGRSLDQVMKEMQHKIKQNITLPTGFTLSYDGQFERQQKSSHLMIILGLLAIFGIFIILYMHFNATLIVMQIMLNIPFSFIGGLIAISLADNSISLASLVAFITLCGIASRNGIMMITHYLHVLEFEGGIFSKSMIIQATLERLIPVLMTTLTAILGLIPLTMAAGVPGKEILHPVAIIIVGGLISSTLLDILVTPTIFYNYGQKSSELYLKNKNRKLKFEES